MGKEYNLISRFSPLTVARQGRVGENPGNEVGKESSLGRRVKTMVTVDWRPPNRRLEPKKKPFEGAC